MRSSSEASYSKSSVRTAVNRFSQILTRQASLPARLRLFAQMSTVTSRGLGPPNQACLAVPRTQSPSVCSKVAAVEAFY